MMFLQSWILLGLPIAFLPIAIHLLNQRRHKPIEWGAMHFLRQATSMHLGAARVRYWLILFVRWLAIACVIVFLSRPLTTGWFGLLANSASKVIIILDRSPSMEMTDALHGQSKRSIAVAKLDAMFESLGNRSERILFLSPDSPPMVVPPNVKLADLREIQGTDASTRMPDLIAHAIRYVQTEGLGPTDIWCCSDLQANDWDTGSGLWSTIQTSLAAFPFIRLTLLAYPEQKQFNAAIRVQRAMLRRSDQSAELLIDLQVQQTSGNLLARTLPIAVHVGENRTLLEVELNGRDAVRTGFVVPIDATLESGAGYVELPSDANLADNIYHFAFAKPTTLRSVVVADDEECATILRLMASTPASRQQPVQCELLSSASLSRLNLDGVGLLVWQGALPVGNALDQLKRSVSAGLSVLFLPPLDTAIANENSSLYGMRWQAWSDIEEENSTFDRWRRDTDLLRDTESGDALPVDELHVRKVCGLDARTATSLASLSDGTSLVCRAATDSGHVYFLNTLPKSECSTLADDGVVLYAMIQRALSEGSGSMGDVQSIDAGTDAPRDLENWESLTDDRNIVVATDRSQHAATYRFQYRWIAINRSLAEDDPATLDEQTVQSLVGVASTRVQRDKLDSQSDLVRELWRWFAIAMVMALLTEAYLTLPSRQVPQPAIGGATT